MNKFPGISVLLSWFSIVLVTEGRTWTRTTGSKIEAEYVETKLKSIVLQKADGSKISIPLSGLSPADRAYVASLSSNGTPVGEQGAASTESTEPVVEAGFAGSPEFDIRSGKLTAGTAFLIRVDGEESPLLVTAQHIFGPPGGLKEEVPRTEMETFTKRASLHDMVRSGSHTTKVQYLALTGTPDVAAFRTTLGQKGSPHALAKENPKMGEVIWLVASLEGQPKKQILHRGVVVAVWADQIKCKFDNGDLLTRGASGAPYLNANGEVAGLHTGSFKDPDGISGAVLPVETIRKAIDGIPGSTLGSAP